MTLNFAGWPGRGTSPARYPRPRRRKRSTGPPGIRASIDPLAARPSRRFESRVRRVARSEPCTEAIDFHAAERADDGKEARCDRPYSLTPEIAPGLEQHLPRRRVGQRIGCRPKARRVGGDERDLEDMILGNLVRVDDGDVDRAGPVSREARDASGRRGHVSQYRWLGAHGDDVDRQVDLAARRPRDGDRVFRRVEVEGIGAVVIGRDRVEVLLAVDDGRIGPCVADPGVLAEVVGDALHRLCREPPLAIDQVELGERPSVSDGTCARPGRDHPGSRNSGSVDR